MGTVCQGCKTFGGGGCYASWAPLKRWEEKFTENMLNITGDSMEAILRKGTGMSSGWKCTSAGVQCNGQWPGCLLTRDLFSHFSQGEGKEA